MFHKIIFTNILNNDTKLPIFLYFCCLNQNKKYQANQLKSNENQIKTMFLKYLSVFLTATVKFALAPPLAYGVQTGFLAAFLLTLSGFMTTVLIMSFFGEKLRIWYQNRQKRKYPNKVKKVFSKQKRFLVRVWTRTGIWGVAFLTPILLSPLAGNGIAVALGVPKEKIIFTMLISGIFWSLAFCAFLEFGTGFMKK